MLRQGLVQLWIAGAGMLDKVLLDLSPDAVSGLDGATHV